MIFFQSKNFEIKKCEQVWNVLREKKLVEKIKKMGRGKFASKISRAHTSLPRELLAVERVYRIQFCGAARRAESENYSDENRKEK